MTHPAEVRSAVSQTPFGGRREAGGWAVARLSCDAEGAFNEADLADNVGLRQPSDLPLADDVHRLVRYDRVQRAVDGSEPLAGNHPLLHKPMVLLNHIVHIG